MKHPEGSRRGCKTKTFSRHTGKERPRYDTIGGRASSDYSTDESRFVADHPTFVY